MFMPDGSASCAYVYPVSVNGRKGGYYDPYANDQDWGLYFMLRYKNKLCFGSILELGEMVLLAEEMV